MAFIEKISFDGTVAGQGLGEQVSIYGQYIVASGFVTGHAVFYKRKIDSNWEQIRTHTSGNFYYAQSLIMYKNIAAIPALVNKTLFVHTSSNDFLVGDSTSVTSSNVVDLGLEIDASDNYIVAGSPSENSTQGVVNVFEKTGESWETIFESQVLTEENPVIGNYFGSSVAVSDDFIVAGVSGDLENQGSVYIFEKSEETNKWEQSYKILASDGAAGDDFGRKVSLSGEYLAVAACRADLSDDEVDAGAVYIFKYSESSDRWFEVKKIIGINEDDLSGNHFGHSLDLQGDYLIVGSPYARSQGVADVFYKKKDWGHLKKITSSSVSDGDSFGESVGIYYPYLVVGAKNTSSNVGRIYIFEDPNVRLRLAQEFDVNREFLPSKASVYLKRSGNNSFNYFPLYSDRENIIDATNFSSIEQGSNKVIFDDRITSHTGNGYMILAPEENLEIIGDSFSVINYPIRSLVDDRYQLWLRCYSNNFVDPSNANFEADILLDGERIRNISSLIIEGEWLWLQTDIVIPDTNEHVLGIKLKEKGNIIDKIYIDTDTTSYPQGEGHFTSESPYITVHMKIYEGNDGNYPVDPIFSYDYKTTINEITQDDWYNFSIKVLDDRESYFDSSSVGSNYFLVLSSSGSRRDNFVMWESIRSDEYLGNFSAISISPGANSSQINLTNLDYYKAKIGESSLDENMWHINYDKKHAFKIYSDFNPIEDV